LSAHSIFREETVTLIKEYVLQKFPPNLAPGQTRKKGQKRKLKPLWHEYNPLRELGYLKANENEESSALNDPDSCAKGSCLYNHLALSKIITIIITIIFIMYRNKTLLRKQKEEGWLANEL
jgi:hypothetical protein